MSKKNLENFKLKKNLDQHLKFKQKHVNYFVFCAVIFMLIYSFYIIFFTSRNETIGGIEVPKLENNFDLSI